MSKLSVDSLSVAIGTRAVLRNVSFEGSSGDWIAVVGPNGAGKSTLLRVLAGLRSAGSGTAVLADADLLTLKPRERARTVSYVPQVFQPQVPYETGEFVALSRYREAAPSVELRDRAAALLEECGMAQFLRRRITELSAGEMQRVLLAAAIFQGGELLLLDEPASFLDPAHDRATVELLHRVRERERRIIVTITHDLSGLSGSADYCLALRDGEQLFYGPTRELLAQRVLDRIFDRRFRYVELQDTDRVLVAYE